MSEPPFPPEIDPRWYREKDLPPYGDPFPERAAARARAIERHDRQASIEASVETINLDMLKVGQIVPIRVPGVMEADVQLVDSMFKTALIDGALRMSGFVLTETLAPEVESKTLKFPDSPFQHWKQKHAGSWWLRRFVRRWPVRNRQATLIVECSRWRAFPESKIRFPNDQLGRPVRLSQITSNLNWE